MGRYLDRVRSLERSLTPPGKDASPHSEHGMGNTPLGYEINERNERTPGYRQKFPGDGPPGDAELAEISARVLIDGYVLLRSTVLGDLVAFYRDEEARGKIPPGFVPYSLGELTALFGEGAKKSVHDLRLIHEAKRQGCRVVESPGASEGKGV